MTVPPSLLELRHALDAAIVGQDEAKTGLTLAWLAREHAYLEGPTGCGKTRLAEAFAHAVGGEPSVLQRGLRKYPSRPPYNNALSGFSAVTVST